MNHDMRNDMTNGEYQAWDDLRTCYGEERADRLMTLVIVGSRPTEFPGYWFRYDENDDLKTTYTRPDEHAAFWETHSGLTSRSSRFKRLYVALELARPDEEEAESAA